MSVTKMYLLPWKLLRVDQLYILQNAPSEGFHEIESIKEYPAKEAEDRG